MKNQSTFLLGIVLSSLIGAGAFATENEKGNGGGAIVCADGDGKITKAYLLDLREAEKSNLTISRSNRSKELQLDDALKKLNLYSPRILTKMKDVLKIMKVVNSTKRLPPPTDTNITELNEPRNCSLEGVASYNDANETLTVDPEIIAKMSQTDLAALYFHEALYRVQRKTAAHEPDSVQARKLTGISFSNQALAFLPVNDQIESAEFVCKSSDDLLEFYIFAPNENKVRVQFTKIPEVELDEKTYSEVAQDSELFAKLSKGFTFKKRGIEKNDPQEAQFEAKQGFLSRWENGGASWKQTYGEETPLKTFSSYSPHYTIGLYSNDALDSDWTAGRPYFVENAQTWSRVGGVPAKKGYKDFTCEPVQP